MKTIYEVGLGDGDHKDFTSKGEAIKYAKENDLHLIDVFEPRTDILGEPMSDSDYVWVSYIKI